MCFVRRLHGSSRRNFGMGRGMSEQCRRAASAPEGGAYLENILAHHPARSLGQVSQVEALQCFRPE